MPKQTFFNLSEEKRNALVTIAIEEFAANDYAAASVSKIVERAGIAKGSIYQYFEDKQEMFLYLVEEASRQLLAALVAQSATEENSDFFTQLRRQMSSTTRVAIQYPLLSQLLRRAYLSAPEVVAKLQAGNGQLAQHHYLAMIEQAIICGELASELSPQMIAWFINAVTGEMHQLILSALNVEIDAAATIDPALFQSPKVEAIYDSVIRLLRNGIGT